LAEQALNGQSNGHPPTLEYLARDDGTAALAHVLQIQNEDIGIWKEAFVDAHSGELYVIIYSRNLAEIFFLR
jgi:extracellular elastinolytic metalloproteinase